MKKSKWILIIGVILCISVFISGTTASSILGLFFLVGLAILLFWSLKGSKRGTSSKQAPRASKQLESHYQSLGLSSREIDIFRQTMNQTKEQIETLQQNMSTNSKLKAINLRHDTTKAAKALFKELVKEPNKLPYANQFLYTHLPNLVDLTNKYLEITNHEIKSKETYDKMEESVLVIDQLAKLIAKDYSQFVSDDFDDLDVEMILAKQSIQQEQK